jgi:hypothetical protein
VKDKLSKAEWGKQPAWFYRRLRTLSLFDMRKSSQQGGPDFCKDARFREMLRTERARVLAELIEALENSDPEPFREFAKTIDTLREAWESGMRTDSAVLWSALTMGIYPPSEKRMTFAEFKDGLKKSMSGFQREERHLRRRCAALGLKFIRGKVGRPRGYCGAAKNRKP